MNLERSLNGKSIVYEELGPVHEGEHVLAAAEAHDEAGEALSLARRGKCRVARPHTHKTHARM